MKAIDVKRIFAAMLAALMLAAAFPVSAFGLFGEGSAESEAEHEERFVPFADGVDPMGIDMEEGEEPKRGVLDVPMGNCEYSLVFAYGQYVAYRYNSVLLSAVTQGVNASSPVGTPWTDYPDNISITREGNDWRITVPEFFEPAANEGFINYFDSDGNMWMIEISCGYPVHYINRQFDYETGELTESVAYAFDYRSVSQNMSNGWFVLDSDMTFSSSQCVTITGTVNLILADGKTLTANNGIYIKSGAVLNVWGQQNDSGKISACPESGPGVGGMYNTAGGDLAIYGGTIVAKGGEYAAGIGGGEGGQSGFGSVLINGGTVTATGGDCAAGIGGGQYNSLSSLIINSGTVTATGGKQGAGIGGGEDRNGFPVRINGGTVKATGGADGGAGIGGGEGGSQGGAIYINDGVITAKGYGGGAGIGGGENYYGGGNGGTVEINGGTVSATGSRKDGGAANSGPSAGIGGGYEGNSGNITINGGKVYAKAGDGGAAGIGGGYNGTNGTIVINDGEVEADGTYGYFEWSYRDGTGIGAGAGRSQYGSITINGGEVIAKGGRGGGIGGGGNTQTGNDGFNAGVININGGYVFSSSFAGAGIGGGGSQYGADNGGNGGNITISGGNVFAISYLKGAGIGGGNDGNGGTVKISGGYVVAIGGYFDYTSNYEMIDYTGSGEGENAWAFSQLVNYLLSDLLFSSEYGGAGIGGGDEASGGSVSITGGTVIASGGMEGVYAIGKGHSGSSSGSLSLYPGAKVSYGKMTDTETGATSIEGIAKKWQRVVYCQGKDLVKIEECDHPDAEYENVGWSGHSFSCDYCELADHVAYLPHEYDQSQHLCTLCGYGRVRVSFDPGDGDGSMSSVWAEKDRQYFFPVPSGFYAPEGMTFFGWSAEFDGSTDVYPAGSSHILTEDVTLTAVWTDAYKLWVGGVQVTAENFGDVLGDGKVTYDPMTCTLNLDNIDGFGDVHYSTLIYAERLNLTITGSGRIAANGINASNGIRVQNGSLRIEGSFTIETNTNVGNGISSDKDVIIKCESLTVRAASYGVRAGRYLYITDEVGKIDSSASIYRAFYANEDFFRSERTVVTLCDDADPVPQDWQDLKPAHHVVIERGAVVTFDLNGGSIDGSTADHIVTVPKNGTVTPPEDPVREELDFGGWYADEALTTAFDFTDPITDDTTVWARWTIKYEVVVTWSDYDLSPGSVTVVLQHAEYTMQEDGSATAEWTTKSTITVDYTGNNWHDMFIPVTYEGADTEAYWRVRELDMYGNVVLSEDELGVDEFPMAIYEIPEEVPDPEEPDPGRAITWRKVAYFVKYIFTGRKYVEVHNANGLIHSVENTWDTDLFGQDEPDEIQVALQRKNSWISWSSVEVKTLNSANGWSATFSEVPAGRVTPEGQAEAFQYRIRQLSTRDENDPDPATEQEILEDADKRTIYDKWDFDKPYLKELIGKFTDPENLWTSESIMNYLIGSVKSALLGSPSAKYHIDQYTDWIGKNIEEHDSKYSIEYKFNKDSNKMEITNINVLDISIYKRWINFDDDEMPDSIYFMLVSKIDDEYAEHLDLEEVNIYTPVLTGVYGDFFDISKLTGFSDAVKNGIKGLVGDNIAATVINSVVSSTLLSKFKVGIAVTEVDGSADNPLARWRCSIGVKKYGGFGVPMEFAGTELLTGFMEMVVDGLIKYFEIPKIHMPIMYDPINGCWSIKGYAINYPVLDEDWELTCNVINIMIHLWDDDEDLNKISGEKKWENDTEADRPDEIKLHIYVKDGEEREECLGSPITVKKEDDWKWEFEVPKGQLLKTEGEGEDTTVTLKDIEIEEDVPEGYTARYESDPENRTYNVINSKITSCKLRIDVTRSAQDSAREQTFIFRVVSSHTETGDGETPSGTPVSLTAAVTLAAGASTGSVTVTGLPPEDYTVSCENGWSWRCGSAASVSVKAELGKDKTASFSFGISNPYWLDGHGSGITAAGGSTAHGAAILPDDDRRRFTHNT